MPNKISFIKYHSLQNDFIIINENQLFSSKHARALCARHSGVGADGILFYQTTDDPYHFTFLVQNADGSDGGFSGNGARCLAAYLFEKYEINEVFLATRTQKIRAIKQDGLVMTKVRLGNVVQEVNIIVDQQEFQAFYVEVGNPHLLFFNTMKTDFFLSNIAAIQKQLAFEQNISLISSTDNGFFITTHERGVGLTQGCSSAALAFLTLLKSDLFKQQNLSLVLSKKITLFMPGGELLATYDDQSVELKAAAFFAFQGAFKKYDSD